MLIKQYIQCIVVGVALFSLSGCKKLIEVDPPDEWLESEQIFSNDSTAKAAMTGSYINIMTQNKTILNGGMTVLAGLSADEISRTFSMNSEDQFATNDLFTSNALVSNNIWKAAYNCLYQCNVILERVVSS